VSGSCQRELQERGATAARELAAEGVRDAQWVVGRAKACLHAGAEIIMIESAGITESV
jgi:hypothetical protein